MGDIERRIASVIDKQAGAIIDFAEDIFQHPELGFKEFRTAQKVEEFFRSIGLSPQTGLAITGVKAYLRPPQEGVPTVSVIGELDAVTSPAHPNADPKTGAAHCCGHHAQIATLVGAVLALRDPEVQAALDGNVAFFAVPSEEYGQIEFKNGLKQEGNLGYLGGKCELIRLGAFEDIDIALGYHSAIGEKNHDAIVGGGSCNGFIAKLVRYIGRESHAAGSPQTGINALNAATLGLTALQFQRETFHDEDTVRVHPILTKGGSLVNVIPGEAVVELLVRARNLRAILDANAKATRAFEAGAYAIGAEVEITDNAGYLPLVPEYTPSPFLEAALSVLPEDKVRITQPGAGGTFSTDFGDLSQVLPVFSFNTSGLSGEAHAANVRVEDPYKAYVLPAKIMAIAVYRLLREQAVLAREIKANHKPVLTREQYIKLLDSIAEGKAELPEQIK